MIRHVVCVSLFHRTPLTNLTSIKLRNSLLLAQVRFYPQIHLALNFNFQSILCLGIADRELWNLNSSHWLRVYYVLQNRHVLFPVNPLHSPALIAPE